MIMKTQTKVQKERNHKPRTFSIRFEIGSDRYAIIPLKAHPEVARVAYRFKKHTGMQEVYDVRLDAEGEIDCSCPGFTFHQKPCKHVRCLVAAGMLPREALIPRHY